VVPNLNNAKPGIMNGLAVKLNGEPADEVRFGRVEECANKE
jgi:hypothetical protein